MRLCFVTLVWYVGAVEHGDFYPKRSIIEDVDVPRMFYLITLLKEIFKHRQT